MTASKTAAPPFAREDMVQNPSAVLSDFANRGGGEGKRQVQTGWGPFWLEKQPERADGPTFRDQSGWKDGDKRRVSTAPQTKSIGGPARLRMGNVCLPTSPWWLQTSFLLHPLTPLVPGPSAPAHLPVSAVSKRGFLLVFSIRKQETPLMLRCPLHHSFLPSLNHL